MGPELNAGHSFVQLVVSCTILEELLITATCLYPGSFLLSMRKSLGTSVILEEFNTAACPVT